MDTNARRRALRSSFKENLADAYTDEEASPPEWVDLVERTRTETRAIREEAARQCEIFASEPDIRKALLGRDRASQHLRDRITKLNEQIRRLNLIAPNARFTKGALDADEVLRPLFRTERNPS